MPPSAPIELNFYDENDAIVETYKRARIPAYLLDMAIQLQAELAKDSNQRESDVSNALFDFIVEFYGNKFNREDVKQKTDLIECMSVLRSIITRATDLAREFSTANPPGPSPKKK